MTNDFQHEAEKKMHMLEAWLAPIFAKFPHIPQGGREVLVQVVPWFALIFGILGIFALITAGTFLSVLSTTFGFQYTVPVLISIIAALVASVLQIIAFKPLTKRKKQGWNYLFYGSVLTTVANIIDVVLGSYVISAVIGAIITFYLLFEIRTMYH